MMGRTKLLVVVMVACVVKCVATSYDELEDFAEHLKKTSQLSPTLKKGVEPDDYDEDEAVSDHAWEDSGKFEGDLILNERQRRLIVEDVAEGLSRNGIRDGTKRWPNNEVIYYIQVEHFTSDQVQAIKTGIEDLARASCVKFRPYRKGDKDAVVIQGSRKGCFSQVGYQSGYQVLNLSGRHPVGRGCFRHGTVVHELLHTLGFYHMQSSPDRDDYVNVIWANIVQPARHNFRKYNLFSVSDFGVGYDYDSVLHYSRRAFSANGQDTIVPKQRGAQIGQRTGLSDKDTQKLNKMYCDADSDSGQADEAIPKKTESKKKNGKNKPFEGHGIGYHQGKAVAIKLLPAPETYKLPDVPSFHVFDYFSKEPQILSTSEIEGFRTGKEIAYSYMPSEPLVVQEQYAPVDSKTDLETKSDHEEIKQQEQTNNDSRIAEITQVSKDLHEKHLSNSKTSVNLSTSDGSDSPDKQQTDPDLIEAFDRLSKIIKVHVYPSQTPDLSIYKENGRYTNQNNPSESDEQRDKIISYPHPIKEDKSVEDELNSAIRYINNIYDYSARKSLSNEPHHENSSEYENRQNQKSANEASAAEVPDIDNNKKYASSYKTLIPSNKYYEDEYVYEVPEYYRDKDQYKSIYSPKSNSNAEKLKKNQDDWHKKYIPFYQDHEYYTDYSKDNSEEPEYADKTNENIYSPSIPSSQVYSVFHVPVQRIKKWYKGENKGHR